MNEESNIVSTEVDVEEVAVDPIQKQIDDLNAYNEKYAANLDFIFTAFNTFLIVKYPELENGGVLEWFKERYSVPAEENSEET